MKIDIEKITKIIKTNPKVRITAIIFICLMIIIAWLSFLHKPKNIIISSAEPTQELINRLDILTASINKKSAASDNKGAISALPLVQAKENDEEKKDRLKRESITLIGIIWDAEEPLALINDQLMAVGEHIDGFTIIEIKRESITLKDEKGEAWVIYII